LIDVGGALYGTTQDGGACPFGGSCGTVFSITPEGSEKVLHSFGKGSDGAVPQAGLIDVAGTLYGTTVAGGEYGGEYGYGTVFSITTSGTEKVLHSFGKGSDGKEPFAGLIDVNGTLYGTTSAGGAQDKASCYSLSCGTVFSITPQGSEKVLHSFGKGSDGQFPRADLTYENGRLIGTTSNGGTYRYGTVFALKL
jgi:uncharacterized repeat protein (TIGR03803 family)